MFSEEFFGGLVGSFVFGVVGIFLLVFGFFMFDWVCKKIDFQHELVENKNTAVAVVIAAFLLSVAYIVAQVVK